jgi:hypothetical protein
MVVKVGGGLDQGRRSAIGRKGILSRIPLRIVEENPPSSPTHLNPLISHLPPYASLHPRPDHPPYASPHPRLDRPPFPPFHHLD